MEPSSESANLDQYSNTENRSPFTTHEAQAGLASREDNSSIHQPTGRPDLHCTCLLGPQQASSSFYQTAGLPSHLQVFHVDFPTDSSFHNTGIPANFKLAWCIYPTCPVHPLGGVLPYMTPSTVQPPLQPTAQPLYGLAGLASAFQPVGSFSNQHNGQQEFQQVGVLSRPKIGPLSNHEKASLPFVEEALPPSAEEDVTIVGFVQTLASVETSTPEADQSCEDSSDNRGGSRMLSWEEIWFDDVVLTRPEPSHVSQSIFQSNGQHESASSDNLQSYGASQHLLDFQREVPRAGFSAPRYQFGIGLALAEGQIPSIAGAQQIHLNAINDPRANSSREGVLDDSNVSRSVSVNKEVNEIDVATLDEDTFNLKATSPYYSYLDFGKYNLPTHFGTSIDDKLKLGVRVTSDYELRIIAREIKDSIKNITVKPSPKCLKQVVTNLMETYKSSLVDDSSRDTRDDLVKKLVRLFAQERKKTGCKLPGGRPPVNPRPVPPKQP